MNLNQAFRNKEQLSIKFCLSKMHENAHSQVDCPDQYFHLFNDTTKACVCFEDNTAYFGNNHRFGAENPQFDRLGCQQSCEAHPECKYWTFSKPSVAGEEGLCYLKTKRENMKFNLTDYVSGSKRCRLPEWQGQNIYVNKQMLLFQCFM